MRNISVHIATLFITCGLLFSAPHADAKNLSSSTTSEKFKDVFITAGYSSLLGLGVSGALIGLQRKPKEKIHWLAYGASAGFLTGAVLGSFVVFTADLINPAPKYNPKKNFRRNSNPQKNKILPAPHQMSTLSSYEADTKFRIIPSLSPDLKKISGLTLGLEMNI